MSVTLDTNIYVSALEFGGLGTRLIGAARAGLIQIDISDAILRELMSVRRDDFHWDGYRLHFMQQELRKACRTVTPKKVVDVLKDDPDDNRILECALDSAIIFKRRGRAKHGEENMSMPVALRNKINKLSPAQREKVEARATELIAEEMALREPRHVRKPTQVKATKRSK